MEKKPYVVIIDRKRNGNSHGDLFLSITVELRGSKGKVLRTKEFKTEACEGEHETARKALQIEIKDWARSSRATFTGEV